MFTVYASVNSTCTQHPPPPLGDPQALAFFLQMPRPPSTL